MTITKFHMSRNKSYHLKILAVVLIQPGASDKRWLFDCSELLYCEVKV